jgi:hypothetical protein
MEIFNELLKLCGEYRWVILAAIVLLALLKKEQTPEEAIDEFKPKNTHGDGRFADNKALRKAGLFNG